MTAVNHLGFHFRLQTPEGIHGARVAFLREVGNPVETRKILLGKCNRHACSPNEYVWGVILITHLGFRRRISSASLSALLLRLPFHPWSTIFAMLALFGIALSIFHIDLRRSRAARTLASNSLGLNGLVT